jgi:hypothetical protein
MMTILQDYAEFAGRHWETGTVRNFLAYRGVKNPYTGEPYSEAFLLGVSGGIVMGYFSFAYEGYDPHARILTRNTFDPLDTLLSRLGIVQNIRQTTKPEKGLANLVEVLESGLPAIVWADMFSLPYNALPYDEGMWANFPILVYGNDQAGDRVWIADRAHVPLAVTTTELAAARAWIKKDKFRILTLEPPDQQKLITAVQAGIWDCLRLYTEAPPKGKKDNFGLSAFHYWANLLTRPKNRLSWEKVFPAGLEMYAGLTSAFTDINIFGKEGYAERDLYADFLDEAAQILDRPGLKEAAEVFRRSAGLWDGFGTALLPDEIPALGEARRLMLERHETFLHQGNAGLAQIRAIDERLASIRRRLTGEFSLDPREVVTFREGLAERLLAIHDVEKQAVEALQEGIA